MFKLIGLIVAAIPVILFLKALLRGQLKKSQAFADFREAGRLRRLGDPVSDRLRRALRPRQSDFRLAVSGIVKLETPTQYSHTILAFSEVAAPGDHR